MTVQPCELSFDANCDWLFCDILSVSPSISYRHNGRFLSRIYPKGMRVDSSNYDPVPSWNCGAQIVALYVSFRLFSFRFVSVRFVMLSSCFLVLSLYLLPCFVSFSFRVRFVFVCRNYQTGADPTWINDGKFMDNGRSGYLLKPQYMREEKITVNPEQLSGAKKTLVVTVRYLFMMLLLWLLLLAVIVSGVVASCHVLVF